MIKLPDDFEKQMRIMLGQEYGSFRKSYEEPYYSALRRNTRKISKDNLVELLGCSADDFDKCSVGWENAGVYYVNCNNDTGSHCDNLECNELADGGEGFLQLEQPGKSPLHASGLYYIQEPSAMLPVNMLKVDDSGMRVLDLCAAPGGKTTQIADRMNGKGILIANEIVPSRAKILSENIERMGVSNAIVISADPHDIADRLSDYFDRILVDAPCSGEGMFRKHPEAMDEWSEENVKICADRQSWILDCAAKMLKPGGRIVYSTCTFNENEDEKSVENFLNRNDAFSLEGDFHRIFPHKDRGEGHFAAALVKDDSGLYENGALRSKQITEKPAKKDSFAPFYEFIDSVFTDEGKKHLFGKQGDYKKTEGLYLLFGDNLFLAPKDTPILKGLKVLRPGLQLGTIIKNRFEPSHSLALFLNKEDAKNAYDLSDDESIKYLKGEAIQEVTLKGWTLATYKGYSLGWGKSSNMVLKNHYPKGLRWM